MRNNTTVQFTVTPFVLIHYIIGTYGKISPIQLINLEHNTKTMQYNLQTPIDTVFNQVEDLLEYGELARPPYTQIKTTNISYTDINRTRKLQDAIKTRNRMNPFRQNWINFKTHFRTSHRKLEEIGELIMEDARCHQYNLVNNIISHMSGLSFPYPPQEPATPWYQIRLQPLCQPSNQPQYPMSPHMLYPISSPNYLPELNRCSN